MNVIDRLLYLGADPKMQISDGRTPYSMLLRRYSTGDEISRHTESILQSLREDRVIPEKSLHQPNFDKLAGFVNHNYHNNQYLPIHLAAIKDYVEDFRFLIKIGADVNAVKPRYGNTALHHVISSQAAKVLIKACANVNSKLEYTQVTSLHYAAKNDSESETFELLIKNGAHVDALDKEGKSPLCLLAAHHHSYSKAVSLLIKAVADISVSNITPLVNALDIEMRSPETTLNNVALDNQPRGKSV